MAIAAFLSSCGDEETRYETSYSVIVPEWQTVYVNGESTTNVALYVWDKVELTSDYVKVYSMGHVNYLKVTSTEMDIYGFIIYHIDGYNKETIQYNPTNGILRHSQRLNGSEITVVFTDFEKLNPMYVGCPQHTDIIEY
ncbi:hypothetical protein [Clostridium sp.]|uniref:hypothetical protein n=1 Tax=Clostridium sp. TaxID=1506 RepID=UPI0025C6FD06|nr:hypothetical protein [Clostridium sp.]